MDPAEFLSLPPITYRTMTLQDFAGCGDFNDTTDLAHATLTEAIRDGQHLLLLLTPRDKRRRQEGGPSNSLDTFAFRSSSIAQVASRIVYTDEEGKEHILKSRCE